jgi:6-phosphogluconate dehydrogenase
LLRAGNAGVKRVPFTKAIQAASTHEEDLMLPYVRDLKNVVDVDAIRGAGHFVKMVHNGIEYGIMAAYAEGLSILRAANVGKQGSGALDAETTPLRHPEQYQYNLNLRDVAEVWRRGSVIASWLLDLTASALLRAPDLSQFAGRVSDSGEGRWTIKAAIDEAVPVPVLTSALYERFDSRGEADFANKLLSAMRYQFGGHLEKSDGKSEVA